MSLLKLPNELLLQAASSLSDPCDLKALLKSNRRLQQLLSPVFSHVHDSLKSGYAGSIQHHNDYPLMPDEDPGKQRPHEGILCTKWPAPNTTTDWIQRLSPKEQREYSLSNLLWIATLQGWMRLARSLLRQGAIPGPEAPLEHDSWIWPKDHGKPPPTGRRSALALAALRGYTDLMEQLLDHGANIEEISSINFWWGYYDDPKRKWSLREFMPESVLGVAIIGGHADAVDLLIRSGADVSTSGKPLCYACFTRNPWIVERLLRAGAGTELTCYREHLLGFTGIRPLQLAATQGCVESVRILLRYGADVRDSVIYCFNNKDDFNGNVRFEPGHLECLRVLLDAGASATYTRGYWATADNTTLHFCKLKALEAEAIRDWR